MYRLLACASVLLAGTSVASANCLRWSETAELSGTIRHQVFPGPPNFESVEDGDAARNVPILQLDEPICLARDRTDEEGLSPAVNDIRELHVVADGRDIEDGPANISGKLFYRTTGYHHTEVLIEADAATLANIQAEPEQPSAATGEAGRYLEWVVEQEDVAGNLEWVATKQMVDHPEINSIQMFCRSSDGLGARMFVKDNSRGNTLTAYHGGDADLIYIKAGGELDQSSWASFVTGFDALEKFYRDKDAQSYDSGRWAEYELTISTTQTVGPSHTQFLSGLPEARRALREKCANMTSFNVAATFAASATPQPTRTVSTPSQPINSGQSFYDYCMTRRTANTSSQMCSCVVGEASVLGNNIRPNANYNNDLLGGFRIVAMNIDRGNANSSYIQGMLGEYMKANGIWRYRFAHEYWQDIMSLSTLAVLSCEMD